MLAGVPRCIRTKTVARLLTRAPLIRPRPPQQAQRQHGLSTTPTESPPPPPPAPAPPQPLPPGGFPPPPSAAAEAAAEVAPPPIPQVAVAPPPPGTHAYFRAGAIVLGLGTGYILACGADNVLEPFFPSRPDATSTYASNVSMTNWSGTHSVEPARYYEPQSVAELESLVRAAHAKGQKIRPVGTALSPNGVSMCEEGMVSLSHVDRILHVDKEAMTVTIEAGARVSQVLDALAEHGLTLQNFSSIQEQQMGGWTQVAAHGTGASLPTVEEQIVSLKLITPAHGVMELSADKDPELFRLAKAGLGSLGIVSEMTLKCVPQHRLLEHTYTTNIKQLRKDHGRLLKEYRHVRYMWLPYTNTVVVVVSNPYKEGDPLPRDFDKNRVPESKKVQAARNLLLKSSSPQAKGGQQLSREAVEAMSFTELRDQLLHIAPTDQKHVCKVNQAEAQYWSLSEGWRLDESTKILGFDCGGQQWVLEVAFPIGRLDEINANRAPDIDFVEKIRERIKELKLPAPCPIEQRWTACSTAAMSPAYSDKEGEIFSWVGIIMYLPPASDDGDSGRASVTEEFHKYVKALEPLYEEYGAMPHWAKVELPEDGARLAKLRRRVHERYLVDQFNIAREGLDPKGILSNRLVETLFAPQQK